MRNGFCFLTDLLPNRILGLQIDARACTAIGIILKLDEPDVSMDEKVAYIVGKLFGKTYPTVLEQTGCADAPDRLDNEIVRFISGADEVKSWKELHEPSKAPATSGKGVKDYDFIQDSEAILASFRQVYGLSLDEVCNLHWWEFLALFRNLPAEGNAFSTIRTIRTKKPSNNDSPEYKASLAKAKRQVALKDTRSPEQKAEDRKGIFDNIDL